MPRSRLRSARLNLIEMRQEDATPLFLTMERLPQDVAVGVAREVQLMNLRDRVRCREMANAAW